MGLITVPQVADGDTAEASDINSPVNTIADEFNGNIESVNLADGAVSTAKIADSAVTSAKVATGMPVQIVSTTYSAVATGTTILPYDDTVPQITEGDEYMTQTITPKSSTNRVRVEAVLYISSSAAQDFGVALFQDTTASALQAVGQFMATSGAVYNIKLIWDGVPGTTSATTFRIRAGGSLSGTTTFNGTSGSRKYGTTPKSAITITEYKA